MNKYNQSVTDSFINTLHTKTSISKYKDEMEDVRQVFGLKKYLKEFSLIDERHVSEVSLWKDYMIFATLFGIADQVIKDMKKINPEYFNMDQVAQQMADEMTLPTIYSTMHSSTSRAAMNKAQRSWWSFLMGRRWWFLWRRLRWRRQIEPNDTHQVSTACLLHDL